jgi:hypothetical protein
MRCHASQPIMAGSTRVVSSPLSETSLLARSCNKAERERYFVFGESFDLPLQSVIHHTCARWKGPSGVFQRKAEPNTDEFFNVHDKTGPGMSDYKP